MSLYLLALCLLLVCNSAAGSFVSNPKNVSPGTTKSLVLRCDANPPDVLVILAMHIKKKEDDDTMVEPEGSSNLTETSSNSQIPESSLDQDNDAEVGQAAPSVPDQAFVRATITSGNNVDLVPALDRYQVIGDVRVPAFLSLTIAEPDASILGMLECQVTYLDHKGNIQSIFENILVKAEMELTLEILERRVKKLEEEVPTFKLVIDGFNKLVEEMKFVDASLREQVDTLRRDTDDCTNIVTALTEEMKSIFMTVQKLDKKGGSSSGGSRLESQDLVKAEANIDHIGVREMQSLGKKMMDLQKYATDTQDRVLVLEVKVNGNLEKRITHLESLDHLKLSESLQELEMVTIPLIKKDVWDCEQNITSLQQQVSQISEASRLEQEQIQQQTITSTPKTTQAPKVYTNPACYVCGSNVTETPCTQDNIWNTMECPKTEPYCMVEVYQTDFQRDIYKSCVSVRDCRRLVPTSNSSCDTENYVRMGLLKCTYCCTSILCNDDLRPTKDLFSLT